MKRTASLALLVLLTLWTSFSVYARSLEEIKKSGRIIIAMTESDYNTINYPLAQEFARYLNVELIIREIEWEEAFMKDGDIPRGMETDPNVVYTPDLFDKVDAVFSTFTILEWRKKLFDFAETLNSAEIIVISAGSDAPSELSQLAGKRIAFMKGTSFQMRMNKLNSDMGGSIELIPTQTSEEAKEMLLGGDIFGVLLDADEALNFISEHSDELQLSLPISPITKTAYAVEKNNPLKREIEDFFETIASNGVLDDIFNRKFGLTYSSFIEQLSKNALLEVYHRDLDEILKSKKLVIALRERNFVYDEDSKQFMHALAEEFAEYLGVELEYVITPYFAKYWETDDGRVVKDSSYTPDWFNYFDLACEVMAPLDWRKQKIDLVGIYPSEYHVIAKKETRINSINDLRELKGITGKGTIYEDILNNNNIINYEYTTVNQFIPMVDAGEADYTILYNAFLELNDYPDLETKISLGELEVCWGLRYDQPRLKAILQEFLTSSRDKGLIRVLLKAISGKTLQSTEDFINSYYESFQVGQIPYVLYGADEGLPQEDVFSIFQDQRGYMWFGTNAGVSRYNGREMEVFTTRDGLGDNTVLDIKQDSLGILYFATTRGISVYVDDHIEETLFPDISFKSIYIDQENNRWFLGDNGVYMLDKDGTTHHLNKEFPELPVNVYAVDEDPETLNKFLATNQGIWYYAVADHTLYKLVDEDCYSIFVDVNDSIWISTKTGLYLTDLNDLKQGLFEGRSRKLNEFLNVTDKIVKGISQNRYGSIWLITDSEILQVLSTDQEAFKYEEEIGLKNNNILSFLVDKEDNIWIGFSGGLQRLTNKRGLRNFYPNTINSYIYSVTEDAQKRKWIASNNGLFYFEGEELVNITNRLQPASERYTVSKLPNGNVLATSDKALFEIDAGTVRVVRKNVLPQLMRGLENILVTKDEEIFILTGINGVVYHFETFKSEPVAHESRHTSNIYQLIEVNDRVLGGNNSQIVEWTGDAFDAVDDIGCNIWSMAYNEKKLWVGTECGLGIYEDGKYSNISLGSGENIVVKSIYPAKNRNYLWLGTNYGFSYFNKTDWEVDFTIDSKDGLSGSEISVSGLFVDSNNLLWIGTYHGISTFNIRAKTTRGFPPLCYIETILLNGEEISRESGRIFKHHENNLVFEIAGLSYSNERSIEYEFYLRGLEHDYSMYNRGTEYRAYYNNLPPGRYEFVYKAKGKNNIWSYAQKYEFTIKKAWYNTCIFRIAVLIVFVTLSWLFYKVRVRQIEAQKKKLEQLVKERTRELEEANAEIEAQRDLAEKQRDQISAQKKEITDSIYYAERIQRSLLPAREKLDEWLPDHFILFKPRDIVSGDFYWASTKDSKIIITAADCTGHGVPGAFMSMLGIAFLNEIVNKYQDLRAHQILNYLRNEIIKALQQKGKEGEQKDGMDMALMIIDLDKHTLEYSGANNSLYLIRDGELMETKADKMPVAIHEKMEDFSLHEIKLKKGDALYISSDGYPDQFGGPKGKKFMAKRFKQLLQDIWDKPMGEQKDILDKSIEEWKEGYDQIDDIVVIGVRT